MYHPPLLQPELLRDLPALLDDVRPRADEPAVLSYRSEAFAEDLFSADTAPVAPVPRPSALRRHGRSTLLFGAPIGVALVGLLLVALGGV